MQLVQEKRHKMSSQLSSDGTETQEETFELLNADEKPEEILELPKGGKEDTTEGGEKEEDKDEEEDSEEEVDELKEIEEELKPPKEEDLLEITTPVRRKEILAKYPKLFKDFPYLEKAYYREQQFTELLPTIQDAKVAVEKAKVLDLTERQVMSGDITSILNAAKSEDREAFNKIADNYLPALKHVDEQAYYHVLGNVIKDTIITMVKEGRALGEQGAPLQAAANVLNQFVFGSQTFTPPTQLSKNQRPEEQSREAEYRKQDQQRAYAQFESVRSDLQTKADNVLKSTIDGHLDPQGTMTSYVKTHAAKEAFDNLETLISKDTRFRTLLDKLWEKAFETNFDKQSTDRIKAAYLSKAKTLLPSVIKKARNDALKGLGRRERVEESTNGDNEAAIKSPKANTSGKSTPPSSGRIRTAKDIPRGMTTLEFLNKD